MAQMGSRYEVHGRLSNSSYYYCLWRHSCLCHEEDTVHGLVHSGVHAETHLYPETLPDDLVADRYHGSAVALAEVEEEEEEEMRMVATFGQVLPLVCLKLQLAACLGVRSHVCLPASTRPDTVHNKVIAYLPIFFDDNSLNFWSEKNEGRDLCLSAWGLAKSGLPPTFVLCLPS